MKNNCLSSYTMSDLCGIFCSLWSHKHKAILLSNKSKYSKHNHKSDTITCIIRRMLPLCLCLRMEHNDVHKEDVYVSIGLHLCTTRNLVGHTELKTFEGALWCWTLCSKFRSEVLWYCNIASVSEREHYFLRTLNSWASWRSTGTILSPPLQLNDMCMPYP